MERPASRRAPTVPNRTPTSAAGLRPPWRSRDVSAGSRRSRSPSRVRRAASRGRGRPRRPGRARARRPGSGRQAPSRAVRSRAWSRSSHPTLALHRNPARYVAHVPIWLGFVWTSPNTLLGLLLGLFTFQAPHVRHGLVVFDRHPRGVTSLMPRLGRTAMTVGFVIVSAAPLEGRLLAHERHHVRQYMVWGPLFIPIYFALAARSATAAIRWRSPPSASDVDRELALVRQAVGGARSRRRTPPGARASRAARGRSRAGSSRSAVPRPPRRHPPSRGSRALGRTSASRRSRRRRSPRDAGGLVGIDDPSKTRPVLMRTSTTRTRPLPSATDEALRHDASGAPANDERISRCCSGGKRSRTRLIVSIASIVWRVEIEGGRSRPPGCRQRRRGVPDLADEDRVGVLTDRVPERGLVRVGVDADLPLLHDRELVVVDDLDRSSTVTMCARRVRLMWPMSSPRWWSWFPWVP